MRTLSLRAATVAVIALAAGPGIARADSEEMAIVLSATTLLPRDGYAGSHGVGAEMRFMSDREPLTMALGGFATVGQQGRGELGRDVFDLRFGGGGKLGGSRWLSAYAGLGLDLLHITTHLPGAEERGTTIGVSAMVGFLGTVGERIVWRVEVGYLGAIVPGTGDDLGGVVLQMGLGARLDD
jgi:hypothetical protein